MANVRSKTSEGVQVQCATHATCKSKNKIDNEENRDRVRIKYVIKANNIL